MGAEGNDRSLRQVLQEMTEPKAHRRSGLIALTAFLLFFEVMGWLLYMAAFPDFILLHNIHISGVEYFAWAGAILLLATVSIALWERRLNKRLLGRVALVLLGTWAIAFLYLSSTPMVMVIDGQLVPVR